jgi:hypothetical protein
VATGLSDEELQHSIKDVGLLALIARVHRTIRCSGIGHPMMCGNQIETLSSVVKEDCTIRQSGAGGTGLSDEHVEDIRERANEEARRSTFIE